MHFAKERFQIVNNISQNFLIPHRTAHHNSSKKSAPHLAPHHFTLSAPAPHHTFMYSMGKQNCALSHTVITCKSFLKYIFPFLEEFFWFFWHILRRFMVWVRDIFFEFPHLTAPSHRNIQNFRTCARAEGYRHVRTGAHVRKC